MQRPEPSGDLLQEERTVRDCSGSGGGCCDQSTKEMGYRVSQATCQVPGGTWSVQMGSNGENSHEAFTPLSHELTSQRRKQRPAQGIRISALALGPNCQLGVNWFHLLLTCRFSHRIIGQIGFPRSQTPRAGPGGCFCLLTVETQSAAGGNRRRVSE